jgi:hypothetical protein
MSKLSPYAQFHFKFIGYHVRNKITGHIYTKSNFWDLHRKEALDFLKQGHVDGNFELVNSPGWNNGSLIKEKV